MYHIYIRVNVPFTNLPQFQEAFLIEHNTYNECSYMKDSYIINYLYFFVLQSFIFFFHYFVCWPSTSYAESRENEKQKKKRYLVHIARNIEERRKASLNSNADYEWEILKVRHRESYSFMFRWQQDISKAQGSIFRKSKEMENRMNYIHLNVYKVYELAKATRQNIRRWKSEEWDTETLPDGDILHSQKKRRKDRVKVNEN